jgi:hypothetical protein
MTKDEIIEMWKNSGDLEILGMPYLKIEAFAKLIAQHERKACLKLAEKYSENWTVDAIKAREALKQLNTEETV